MWLDPGRGGEALYAGLVEESREAGRRLSDSASLPILTPCEAVTALAAADVALEARGADRLTGEQLRPRYTQIAWRPEAAAFVANKAAMLAGRRGVLETILDARIAAEDMVMPAPLRDKKRNQLGRASCRERGGP